MSLASLLDLASTPQGRAGVTAALAVGVSASYLLYQRYSSAKRASLEASRSPLGIVITGGSKGLGKALAKRFLQQGDSVVICGRTAADLDATTVELRAFGSGRIFSIVADVGRDGDVDKLLAFALEKLPGKRVDAWINNAGCGNGAMTSLADMTPQAIERIVSTNLLGTLYCCRAAIASGAVSHIFNMDGAGSAGFATPRYAVYGITKAGFPQLLKSLVGECKKDGAEGEAGSGQRARGQMGIHNLSPGMVITDLLLGKAGAGINSSSSLSSAAAAAVNPEKLKSARIFNILAERADTVADWMVPKVTGVVVESKGRKTPLTGTYHKYLTPASAAWRFLKSVVFRSTYRNRLLDEATGEEVPISH